MARIDAAAIEQRAKDLAQFAGEVWAALNNAAREHYRNLARKQLEREAEDG